MNSQAESRPDYRGQSIQSALLAASLWEVGVEKRNARADAFSQSALRHQFQLDFARQIEAGENLGIGPSAETNCIDPTRASGIAGEPSLNE